MIFTQDLRTNIHGIYYKTGVFIGLNKFNSFIQKKIMAIIFTDFIIKINEKKNY